MKRLLPLLCAGALLMGGCSPHKPKEVSDADRVRAENCLSEAQFAMQVHQYSRAEGLYLEATKIRGDYPEYWVALGMSRAVQKNTSGARSAYKKALEFFKDRYYWEKKPEDLGQQAWTMALLGRTDDAIAFLKDSLQKHPDSQYLKQMADPRGLPRTFQTDDFKAWVAQ